MASHEEPQVELRGGVDEPDPFFSMSLPDTEIKLSPQDIHDVAMKVAGDDDAAIKVFNELILILKEGRGGEGAFVPSPIASPKYILVIMGDFLYNGRFLL